ncbi:MAG: VOC family protein [bacterium]
MKIVELDHFVLTVKDIEATVKFYTKVLGMESEQFVGGGAERTALKFGHQKINLHQLGNEFKPVADKPLAGSGDFCLITETPVEEIVQELERYGIQVVEGPVRKTGAIGPLWSIYLRDPDNNLIEISNR